METKEIRETECYFKVNYFWENQGKFLVNLNDFLGKLGKFKDNF